MPNDAFTLAVQCGGCGVSVVRQWPRARFRRAAYASVAIRPHGQRECTSPAPLATPRATARRLHEIPGGSPVAAWQQESTGQPPRRLLSEPPSDSMWLIVPVAGRLPAGHRDCGDSGTVRLSAPTSASADHAAGGSSVDGGTLPRRHESRTNDLASNRLAATGRKAAFAACHYPLSAFRTPIACRVVTGDRRVEPPPSPRRHNAARGASDRPQPSQGSACIATRHCLRAITEPAGSCPHASPGLAMR